MSRILRWEREKDPQEFIDYSINWADEIGSDTISLSTWAYSGSPDTTPLVLSNGSISSAVTTIWLDDGTTGTNYTVTNTITTAGSRVMEQSVYIAVRTR
jgi:hypothetical protein